MPPRRYRVNAPQRQPGRCAGAHCTSLLGYGIFATTFGSRATVGGGQGGGRRRPLCRQPEWRRARSCSGRPVRQAKAPPTQTRMVKGAWTGRRTPTETMPLPATIPYGTTTSAPWRAEASSSKSSAHPCKKRTSSRNAYVLSVARLPPELLLLLQPQPAGLRPLPHPRLSLGRRAGGLRPAGRHLGLRRLDGRGAPSQARRDRAVLREVPSVSSLGAHPPVHGRRPA